MQILLMRHGQTDLNVQKRLQGSSDIPLNACGRQQARDTHAWMVQQGIHPTKIISSPLERAVETGCIAAGWTDSNAVERDNDLIEMAFGIYEQQNTDEIDPTFLTRCFDHPESFEPPEGGESYDEVLCRVERFIERLRKRLVAGEFAPDEQILLVSHGATSHGIFEYLKKTPRAAYWDVDFNNCAIAELQISADGRGDDYRFLTDGFEKNW